MQTILRAFIFILFVVANSHGAGILEEPVMQAFSQEVSGETAKRNLEFLTRQHRMRGSTGFKNAVEFIAGELHKYGLEEIKIEEFPADGKKFYGTQRSRRPWDANFAELWEMKVSPDGMTPLLRIASWDAVPLSLAQDSESGEVTTTLVDTGEGVSDSDYTGKDVKGKLVLVSQQPEQVIPLAIDKYNAAGIVSYAQNQRTAWWGEDENLLRWGHVGSFNKNPTFAFMVTLKQARSFQKRLLAGEKIQLRAKVDAGQHEGVYQVLTAVIQGADPQLQNQEIVFSCHLDHPRPGANDNASGCATILEVARTFTKLISERKINKPARTLRFVWPPEIEGTMTLLTARPEIRSRMITAIHMDMVGGGPVTKSQFQVTRGPASRPSFIYDVADSFAEFVNRETLRFAETGTASYPLIATDGGKEPLRALLSPFSMGSDHEVYAESSFCIPAIYFNDWPDRYIHTNFDTAANIDPTKLKRAAFLGAITANYLANLKEQNIGTLWEIIKGASIGRMAELMKERSQLSEKEWAASARFRFWYEQQVLDSFQPYIDLPEQNRRVAADMMRQLSEIMEAKAETLKTGNVVYKRNPEIQGAMGVFGYNYLEDHYGTQKAKALKLLKHSGTDADGSLYAYEALNFVDGNRSIEEIVDLLSGAYGPVPVEMVAEYLAALESIDVIRKVAD